MTRLAKIDPVTVIRSRIEGELVAGGRGSALPRHWSRLARTKPTTAEGAAILIREAGDYEDELHAPDLAFAIIPPAGAFYLIADRVRTSRATPADLDWLDGFAKASGMMLGLKHPMATLLANASTYLRSGSAV